VLIQNLRPIRLSRRGEPFDFDQFIFELKVDSLRALAHIEAGQGETDFYDGERVSWNSQNSPL
jgi:hypothetical protein